jgi:hypothetical protein
MPRTKPIIVVLLLIFVFSAAAADSASAAWIIEGTELAEGQTRALATTAVVDQSSVLHVPGLPLKISCSGLSTTKPELLGSAENAVAEAVTVSGCAVAEPTTCSLLSPTIVSDPVLINIGEGISPDERALLEPQSGHVLSMFTLEGSSCSISGRKALDGAVFLNAPTLQNEATEQALEGLGSIENEGYTSLQIAGDSTFLEGSKLLLKLQAGNKFAFRPPKVKAEPKSINFKEIKTGESAGEVVVFTNEGARGWQPNVFKFNKAKGGVAFTAKVTVKTPCNKVVLAGKTCEEIVDFAPTNKEEYEAVFKTLPASEPVVVEGKGK